MPTADRRSPRHAGGFTLVETLVVLIIVATIGAIVMTSYQRILDIRIRLAAFLDGTDAPTLVAGWFRSSIEGLMADPKDGFGGTATGLAGLSAAAIDGIPGVPTRIAWELVYDPAADRTSLRYRRGDRDEMTIASWPGNRGGLRYCDPLFHCSDSWPPPTGQTGGPLPTGLLPALVVLEAIRGTTDWPIAAAPRSARDPLPKQDPFLRPS